MLTLTPQMLAAGYDFLRECPPYRGWKLPHSDAIAFKLVRDPGCHGYYQFNNGHVIGVCDLAVGHNNSLIQVLAHEMIHLYQYIARRDTSGTIHNADFRKLTERVCRIHGWDAKMFFI